MTFASTFDIQARHLLITQRLRRRRDDLGLTQKQVVTRLGRCGLRTTNRALSSLEHGTGLDVAKLPELAAALDCTVTYLVGLTDDPHRWEPDDAVVVPPRPTSVPASTSSVASTASTASTAPVGPTAPAVPPRISARASRPSAAAAITRVPGSLILGVDIPERRLDRR